MRINATSGLVAFAKGSTVFILLTTSSVHAATQAQLDTMRAKSLAYLITQQQGDGSWRDAQGNGIQATVTALEALNQAGMTTGYVAGAGAAWLENAEAKSVDSLARQITTLSKLGIPATNQLSQLINMTNPLDGGWGAYKGYETSMPDTALALDALLSEKSLPISSSDASIIVNLKSADGGWSYRKDIAGRAKSALVPTVYGVLVLSNIVKAQPSIASVANTSIANGVNWLLSNKKNDNGYAEDLDLNGVNTPSKPGRVFETSLVKTALSAAKTAGVAAANTTQVNQALSQIDDFLVSRQAVDGSWGGEILQTALVGQALPATVLADTDKDGVPDTVEAFISGSNINVADSRNLPKGNGDPAKPAVIPLVNENADVPLPAWAIALMGASMIGIARKRRKAGAAQEPQAALNDINNNTNTKSEQ